MTTEIVPHRPGLRFRALMKFARAVGVCSAGDRIDRILSLSEGSTVLNEVQASFVFSGQAFYFNALSLSWDQLGILFDRIYKNDGYRIRELPEKPLVVDIGSHLGILPRVIFDRHPEAKVYAVEPDPENYEILRKNLLAFEGAKTFPMAIYFKDSVLELYRSQNIDWRSISLEKGMDLKGDRITPEEFQNLRQVQGITLNDFLGGLQLDHLDMLKITVGGEIEDKILESGLEAIKKLKPSLWVLVYPKNLEKVRSTLKTIHYQEVENAYSKIFIRRFEYSAVI